MTPDELTEWLREHAAQIFAFTDYEIALSSEEDLRAVLGESWFRDADWNEPGYRFLHLGHDGTGGEVALWLRPGDERSPPVVFFGSEGGTGVLAPSPDAWVKALAYGPAILEYADVETATSRLSIEENEYLAADADPAQKTEAEEHLDAYRRATIARFGSLPPFDELVAVDEADQRELKEWVTAVLDRVFAREESDAREAAAKRHRESRARAETYAAASADGLPEDPPERADGSRYPGRCAACQTRTELRLTRFEELRFGLCLDCYFSPAW